MKNYPFYKSLHGRGQTLETLAAKIKSTPTHLSMVFSGRRGRNTRKHLAEHLTLQELNLLGWNERGEVIPATPNTCTNCGRRILEGEPAIYFEYKWQHENCPWGTSSQL